MLSRISAPSLRAALPLIAPANTRPRRRSKLLDTTANRALTTSTTPPSSAAPSDECIYVAVDQLKSVDRPSDAVKLALKQLRSDDWNVRFNAITMLRRIAVKHNAVFITDACCNGGRSLLKDVVGEIDSLRSAIAKNALLLATDLFTHCGQTIADAALLSLPSLLRRSGDESGSFLASEATSALLALCKFTANSKYVSALFELATAGNRTVRTQATKFIHELMKIKAQTANAAANELFSGAHQTARRTHLRRESNVAIPRETLYRHMRRRSRTKQLSRGRGQTHRAVRSTEYTQNTRRQNVCARNHQTGVGSAAIAQRPHQYRLVTVGNGACIVSGISGASVADGSLQCRPPSANVFGGRVRCGERRRAHQ